ncbi:MAG: aldehyde ferredoxin oxidoreductase family protein [Firmicutes bacterium]|nr:aldehyde ferredoxin oxidoreductase family protein [Bacillota bacterium]
MIGRVAFVDLGSGSIDYEEIDEAIYRQFVGSRGMAASSLYEMAGPATDPLGPDNPLIFSVGPLTGTPWPTAARYVVTAKSPATGAYGYGNASGHFGPALRSAGFDMLFVTGKARNPVYLLVEAGRVTVKDASDIWGSTTEGAEMILRGRHPGSRVASIGPAGENLVRFAAVINDYGRAAARTGMGAVMGSKRLKAVAAVKGASPPVSHAFREVAREAFNKVSRHPGSKGLAEWGTPILIKYKNLKGDLPSKNHQLLQFPWSYRVDAEALAKYTTGTRGCFACPIKCSRLTAVSDGPYKCELEGPEYESVDALGPMIWNNDPELVIYANKLCNLLGIDTISTGVVIAFAMECGELGLLKSPDYSLGWGDGRSIVGLIHDIANRRGLGAILANGVRDAATEIGGRAVEVAMHVKGVEIPRQEPRVCKAFGLGHAVSNRGADHLYALPTIDLAGNVEAGERLFPDIMPELMDFISEKHKARLVKFTEEYSAVTDCVGVCKFSTLENYALYPDDVAAGLTALGLEFTEKELLKAGERVVNIERMFNVRCGLDRKDDALPKRFTHETGKVVRYDIGPDGEPVKGAVVREGLVIDLDRMIDEYYELRGWDRNGIPTPDKLKELGLDCITGHPAHCRG